MANETKKRLLLSKWRIAQTDAQEEIDKHKEALAEQDDQIVSLMETLESVRWFFLDPLVHHRPMTDPRAILRKIEDVLQ